MVNGGSPERVVDLLTAVSQQAGGKPVQALFNADWHPEYTGANATLGKAGTKIIALITG